MTTLKQKLNLEPLFKPLALLIIALGIYELVFTDGYRFIVLLATYRLSYLVVSETGPFALAIRLRTWVYNKWGFDSWQFNGIRCLLCVSFWLAFGTAWVLPGYYVLNVLAVAGGCLIIHKAMFK